MSENLPFSQAAENNSAPILKQLAARLKSVGSVLEIGSGTGQHAVTFARALPHLEWHPSEHPDALSTLLPRIRQAELPNLHKPVAIDISVQAWAISTADAIYTANTLHIVSEALCESFFAACKAQAKTQSQLLIYGPFNYAGRFTSASNESFDAWLKARDPLSGIRDFEWIEGLATDAGYTLIDDQEMPANNRLLCWKKTSWQKT